MEKEFLNRFYSTRRVVSLTELTNTKHWKDEVVIDYINRWRSLSLECKDRLSEVSAVEMFIQGMNLDLVYILQGIKPRTFQELATRAHDKEITIANHRGRLFPRSESKPKRKEFKKTDKSLKSNTKESMTVITSNPVKISARPKSEYCRYHRVISHPLEKCITLKEKIMQLAKDGKILLDLYNAAESNCIVAQAVAKNVVNNPSTPKKERVCMIQFGTLEPSNVNDEEGWTLLTRRRRRKSTSNVLQSPLRQSVQNKLRKSSSKKNQRNTVVSKSKTSLEPMKPKPRQVIMLEQYFPCEYLDRVTQSTKCVACNTALAFSDEDLLLGSKPHNRPFFVSGYIRKQKVSRILVDGGSAVNIMPKATMLELGIFASELSKSRLLIQGFNLSRQRSIGMIHIDLVMGELSSATLFQVTDAKTSYKLLLGRPWLHENGVVASTLHQCLKFYRNGEKKVNRDVKPFTEAKTNFADAKFYHENEAPKATEIVVPTASRSTPIFKYVPKSRRKEGETPFAEYSPLEGSSSKKMINDENLKTLK
ncbi:hypothetical protein RND81_14G124000 [Saponaria officinalis]|uniref:Retrotransposon gag domain-containing protein n=1 Tax=Saponaria officinalis TaxID=3572 RepID=A0AAW1GRI7_SAPOF